jgi:probable blue pigment (indigoidine) exporter
MSSMETISAQPPWNWTVPVAALIAPVAWGSTYIVTENWLPPDRPLFAAAMRALPIGLIIVTLKGQLPHGVWWWRSLVLGTLNIGLFFALIFTAAYRLPGGLASTVTAMSPLAVMLLAAFMIGERPTAIGIGGGVVGVAGVALLVLRAGVHVDVIGLLAAIGAVLVSGVGFVLVKRWERPADLLTVTGWQLASGGLVLVPATLIFEGRPPSVDLPALASFAYLGIVGTGLAYFVWFRGLTRMPAGSTSLLGLVNPVVGTALGVTFMHEAFGGIQVLGVVLVLAGVLAGQPAVVAAARNRLRRTSAPAASDRCGARGLSQWPLTTSRTPSRAR